jgi:hypothetical protein
MDILPVTPEQVLAFVAVTAVPAIVDVLRVGLAQLAVRFNWQWLNNLVSGSKFGIVTTMLVSLVAGLSLAIWLGGVEPTLPAIGRNALAILGWATAIYKGGYEKSEVRKVIVTAVDKIGGQIEGTDTDTDLPKMDIVAPESIPVNAVG